MKKNNNNNLYKNYIKVKGAREHNLKNVSVSIPKDSLTVITGPSGSGKTTLALDILYTEGKRRYIESLSSYARQFLGLPKKPKVDKIEGLCPSIAIDQKTVSSNPRSTVGTITEIYDYLRVLFARIGKLACPKCNIPISSKSSQEVAELLINDFKNNTIILAAPYALHKKGTFINDIEQLFDQGHYRFLIDGKRYTFKNRNDISLINLKKTKYHTVDVLLDCVEVTQADRPRLQESIDKAFNLAKGKCKAIIGNKDYTYAKERICLNCSFSFPEIEPRLFSFNSPMGACRQCHGLGLIYDIDEEYEDIFYNKNPRYNKYNRYKNKKITCTECNGKRLNKMSLAIDINNKNINNLSNLSVKNLYLFFNNIQLNKNEKIISKELISEIKIRLQFLIDVGLEYLTLNRSSRTLSGGEGQRIRLATQIGSALSGVLYILDEPSIGLHQRDNDRLLKTLYNLKNLGNTVLVVEHDIDTMKNADYIIDMGPAAGKHGGEIIAMGTPNQIANNPQSLSGSYLNGKRFISIPNKLRQAKGYITLKDLNKNNLKNVELNLPLGILTGISGVSGSGKSTLIMEELVTRLKEEFNKNRVIKDNNIISKDTSLDNLVTIDQTPIGKTNRSTPATYLGIFDHIRALFASLPESNVRGYKAGRFSFNTKEGSCPDCLGQGINTVSMHFLADLVMQCKTCKGERFDKQTLEILYKGKNIAQILNMPALEALEFFENHSQLKKRLKLMCDVGLDYVTLGQSSTTLSGGEAQRIKLASELSKRGVNTLYILDEPTTGLHTSDIEKLLKVLNKLVDKGNSLVVIEHNLDVLKTCDHIIDLGPEGGDNGGSIVAQGIPKDIAKCKISFTGQYLNKILNNKK